MNCILYLPKSLGGRGLKSIEQTYKETCIKSAARMLNSKDQRIQVIAEFHRVCQRTNHATILKEAIKYAKEMNIEFKIAETSFHVEFKNEEKVIQITDDVNAIKEELIKTRNKSYKDEVMESNWQGMIFKARYEDADLMPGCFEWLRNWKSAPTNVIRDIYDLYCQTLKTKCFEVTRSKLPPTNTICRLCKHGNETVHHILNTCNVLLKSTYLKRHNQVLQCYILELLAELKLITVCPPWYSPVNVKPFYVNEEACMWWDIPEYSGSRDEISEEELKRPDGKVMLKKSKKIFLIEMTCPWIKVRELRYEEKREKYKTVRRNIKINNPEYDVEQITLVMDSLGGYSKNLVDNIKVLIRDRSKVNRIITKMQKAMLSQSVHITRRFKIETFI